MPVRLAAATGRTELTPRRRSSAWRSGVRSGGGAVRPAPARAAATLVAITAAALLAGCGGPEPAGASAPAPEAGFVTIEPVEYTLHGQAEPLLETSSEARLFYSFHPADTDAETRPLFVVYSGGPGASTGILLGGNTAPLTVDPSRTGDGKTAPNSASWTAFANVLHVDARGCGLSYGVAPGMTDSALRDAEFTERNFNPYLDAADIVRVTLRFLDSHPALRGARVVLTGESYGGVRTEIALHLLHAPDRYELGSSAYVDPALASEIRAHFSAAGTTALTQFDRAVLLQPRLTSPQQQAAAGAALEAPGSPLFAIAGQVELGFVPCSQQGDSCSPYPNAVAFLAKADRDLYDIRKPAGDAFARYAALGDRLADPDVLAAVLGVPLDTVALLRAKERGAAYRLAGVGTTVEPLAARLGEIAPYDRYFELELFDLLGAPFVSPALKALGLDRTDGRWGSLFLEDLATVKPFITNAAFDAAIWTPSLPEALAMYTGEVAGVHRDGESFVVEYAPGAFGLPAGTSRAVRFPTYAASGHSVALDEPAKLAADIEAWLAETE